MCLLGYFSGDDAVNTAPEEIGEPVKKKKKKSKVHSDQWFCPAKYNFCSELNKNTHASLWGCPVKVWLLVGVWEPRLAAWPMHILFLCNRAWFLRTKQIVIVLTQFDVQPDYLVTWMRVLLCLSRTLPLRRTQVSYLLIWCCISTAVERS